MTTHHVRHLPLPFADLVDDLNREMREQRHVTVKDAGLTFLPPPLDMQLNDGLVLATLVANARRACPPTDTIEASYKRLMTFALALVEGRRA